MMVLPRTRQGHSTAACCSNDENAPTLTQASTRHPIIQEELIREHERARSEWQRRKDGSVSDVDLSRVLKVVHPAYGFSHDATVFLAAFVRELQAVIVAR